ncbi:MAG: hydantoinase B/oxoprolinase family protein [Alphaproteobacteria bacterium]
MTRLDPVTLALTQNRLDHISRQMGWVMTRTARSPIFSQAHDFSCFLADAEGVLVSQADGIPIHTGGGGFAVRALLKAFAGDIRDGDVFLLNDPYTAGGNHLPDWVIARPVFVGGTLTGFANIRAHQSDIGGGAAGSYNPGASEIFHEGIRLPPLLLIREGRVREDLWQLLMLNTRTPDLLDGDLRAMIGATRIGAEQIADLHASLGAEASAYLTGVLDHADRRLRAAVAELPDGTYRGEDRFEDDCFEPMDIPIKVAITVEGDALTVDFSGSHPQIRGFKNSSVANTWSGVYTALSSFFGADIPRNEGTFRSVRIIAPEGSILNPRPPAPMTMNTIAPACEIINACWQALGQADPSRSCAGWGKPGAPVTSGTWADGRTFVMYHWAAQSGGGAVEGRDGFPQQGGVNTLCGLVIPNAESYEQLYPVRVIRQELRLDSAGPGTFRGGAGVDYEVEIQRPMQITFRGEAYTSRGAFGVAGGGAGATGRIGFHPAAGGAPVVPRGGYGVVQVGPGRIRIASAAGGGWGAPGDRDPALVRLDVLDGIVSAGAAAELYGVEDLDGPL